LNMNIGFVGVGRMGANMARRLKDRGFCVTAVYDTNRKAATDLAGELGCAAAQDLSDVTAESDAVFTVVTDDNAMRQIFSGAGDNLLKNARGKLFVNCATISPQVHVEVAKLAEKAGAESLEACMASSITQAREGKLYLMCGGNEKAFRTAQPVLKELAASVRFIGTAGEAAKVKALVNMVMNINTVGLAEGLGLGDALGLEQAAGLGDIDVDGVACLQLDQLAEAVASVEIFTCQDGHVDSVRHARHGFGIFRRHRILEPHGLDMFERLGELDHIADVVAPMAFDGEIRIRS